jgi:hypothetical protein
MRKREERQTESWRGTAGYTACREELIRAGSLPSINRHSRHSAPRTFHHCYPIFPYTQCASCVLCAESGPEVNYGPQTCDDRKSVRSAFSGRITLERGHWEVGKQRVLNPRQSPIR